MHKHPVKLLGVTMLAIIGAMAVSASAAQAKLLLLLNGKSVNQLILTLEYLPGYIKAENGLKLECTGGTGTATAEAVEEGKKVTGSASFTFTGCKWAGNKFCTINDGGVGLIKLSGSGELTMPDGLNGKEYLKIYSSASFAKIKSEGEFCTIPEEETLSGTMSLTLLEGDNDTTKVKLGHLKSINLLLGKSKITECVGEVHIRDQDPNATWGISLVNLI